MGHGLTSCVCPSLSLSKRTPSGHIAGFLQVRSTSGTLALGNGFSKRSVACVLRKHLRFTLDAPLRLRCA